MRGWDQLLDAYLAEYGARGLSEETVRNVTRQLDRWGQWMKRCRPRPKVEQIDAPLIVRFIRSRSSFKSKATVYGTLSMMRGMGEYLVREGVWQSNPMRWMRGPKVTPYSRLPMRLNRDEIDAMWKAVVEVRGAYRRALWVTVLSLLYGTGLRRGELSRLQLDDWDRGEGMLRIDGRKTGWQRQVPVPGLTYRCLETYLPLRQNELLSARRFDEQALLIGLDGRPLTADAIGMGVHRIARRAGVSAPSRGVVLVGAPEVAEALGQGRIRQRRGERGVDQEMAQEWHGAKYTLEHSNQRTGDGGIVRAIRQESRTGTHRPASRIGKLE